MKKTTIRSMIALLIMTIFSSFVFSNGDDSKQLKPEMFNGLETDAAKVVIAFKEALQTNDVKAALSLLAENVLIFEGKGVERSAQKYASHHMLSDMKYLEGMKIETIEHHVTEYDAVGVSFSRSRFTGVYQNKKIDRLGNETITLEKQNGEWKITHIHWSN